MSHLVERISAAVQPVVGSVLTHLHLRSLGSEIQSQSELEQEAICVGGEIRLGFGERQLFVCWEQGGEGVPTTAAVEDDCRVCVRASSFLLPDAATVEWDLSEIQPWRSLVGSRLESARVLSMLDSPNILELSLQGRQLTLANSNEWDVGCGTDLLVTINDDPAPCRARPLWTG